MKKLSLDYYQTNVPDLAPDLIGRTLCHQEKDQVLMGRTIETEAYLQDDKVCHAYRGKKTQRTAPLFLQGGHIYTYFAHGIHTLFNIVTGPRGNAQAVLVRALDPVRGEETFYQRRFGKGKGQAISYQKKSLLSGSAKLTQALSISLEDNKKTLDGSIYLLDDGFQGPIETTKRIGIDYAQETVDYPHRFILKK